MINMESNLLNYLKIIDQSIIDYPFPNHPENLYAPMRYILNLGGKRIRPVLTLMGCELFNTEYSDAKDAALAIEFFHNFSLIHDDIMDAAPLRRGEPTVHTKWNSNNAILSGDALLVEAYKLLVKYEPKLSHQLLRDFNKTASEVCEGQQLDMNFENEKFIKIDEYIEMIRLKTAVLLGCSLKIGAIIGGANNIESEKLYSFGVNLGIAFQLQDDLLDLYGNPEKVGKQIGGDVLLNKKTFLLLSAFEGGNQNQKEELHKLINEVNVELKISRTKEIFSQLKIQEKTNEKIKEYYTASLLNLDQLNCASTKKIHLQNLADYLIQREH